MMILATFLPIVIAVDLVDLLWFFKRFFCFRTNTSFVVKTLVSPIIFFRNTLKDPDIFGSIVKLKNKLKLQCNPDLLIYVIFNA